MKRGRLTGDELTKLTTDINGRIGSLTDLVQANELRDIITNSGLNTKDQRYFLNELGYKAGHLNNGYVPPKT